MAKRRRHPWHIILPVQTIDLTDEEATEHFTWPKFDVRPSNKEGYGLFAREPLRRNDLIPILGRRIEPEAYSRRPFSAYKIQIGHSTLLQLNPDGAVTAMGAYGGRAITAMINEPIEGERVNTRIKGGYYMVIRDIEPGEEVLVDYGDAYERHYRRVADRGDEYLVWTERFMAYPKPLEQLWV